jgi:hypothetical protein
MSPLRVKRRQSARPETASRGVGGVFTGTALVTAFAVFNANDAPLARTTNGVADPLSSAILLHTTDFRNTHMAH